MKRVNLKDMYPLYNEDCFIEVTDAVAAELEISRRTEHAQYRYIYRNKAQFSLDQGDGIEHDILFASHSPVEIYERKLTKEQLYTAIAKLPEKQAKRVCAHFFMEMSKAEIASSEGVSKMAVCESIDRGLRTLEKEIKKYF